MRARYVGEVGIAEVFGQPGFECGDQASNVSSRPAIGGRHEHKPCMTAIARSDQLGVKRSEILQVGRHDRTPLRPRKRNDIVVVDVMPAIAKRVCNCGREHLVEQELQRWSAA